jgi:hypothetical protein
VGTFFDENGAPFKVPGAEFASSVAVALDAELAAVGTNRDDSFGMAAGAVYLFRRQNNGTWAQSARIGPTDGAPCAKFGSGVALQGEVLLVRQARAPFPGCPTPPPGSGVNDVRIFELGAGGWVQTRTLRYASSGAIAVDGNIAVIGLPGGADVYQRVAPGLWVGPIFLQQRGIAGNVSSEFFRGLDVGISDGRIVLGTVADAKPAFRSGTIGRANVFERNASGDWVLTADLVTDALELAGGFGSRVSISGKFLSIGGTIYERDAWGSWTLSANLAPTDSRYVVGSILTKLDRNGTAVVYSSSYPSFVTRTDVYRGAAGGVWNPAARLRLSGDLPLNGLFSAEADSQVVVAISGSRIVAANDDGYVYVFEPAAVIPSAQLELIRIDPGITTTPSGRFTVTAFADTRSASGSRIRDVAVQIANGPWQTLQPQYTAFGGASVTAAGTIATSSLEPGSYGSNRVCLRVTDEAGIVTELLDRDTSTCGFIWLFSEAQQAQSTDSLPPTVPEQMLYRTRLSLGQDNSIYAFADDGQGGSGILGLDYQVDAGVWLPMKPDAPNTGWGAGFQTGFAVLPPSREPGSHTVCVRAIDSVGNIAYPPCLSFETVQ